MVFLSGKHPVFLPKTSMEVALSLDLELTTFYLEPTSPLEWNLPTLCVWSTWSMPSIFISKAWGIPIRPTGLFFHFTLY